MIYGSEKWAMKVEHTDSLEKAEARMVRLMIGVSLQERKPTDDLRKSLGINSISDTITRARLRWYGHVHRKREDDWVKRITQLQVDGRRQPGRPLKSWRELVNADLQRLRLRTSDADDRDKWREAIHGATSNLRPRGRRTLSRSASQRS